LAAYVGVNLHEERAVRGAAAGDDAFDQEPMRAEGLQNVFHTVSRSDRCATRLPRVVPFNSPNPQPQIMQISQNLWYLLLRNLRFDHFLLHRQETEMICGNRPAQDSEPQITQISQNI
jgi:hypothetical protein